MVGVAERGAGQAARASDSYERRSLTSILFMQPDLFKERRSSPQVQSEN